MAVSGGDVVSVVNLNDVGLAYRLARNRSGSMKQFAVSLVKGQVSYEKLWALREVSFELERGQVLGVIGRNGAGKSTLMKTIVGVLPPTEGHVRVEGRVSAMIELGAGFNQDLDARENVILYGTLLGSNPTDMAGRVDRILDWADLSEFRDVPIRNFSSGMLARLGFSVATDIDPEVLVVDEVLAVGDQEFRAKSAERVEGLIQSGATVILVSHTLPRIKQFADKVIWLDHGLVQMMGEPDDVIDAYKVATTH